MKELDCVNIMMKMRQLELLISLFLNSKQKFLLNFQKKNVITDDRQADACNLSETEEDETGSLIFNKYTEDIAKNSRGKKGHNLHEKVHDALLMYSKKSLQERKKVASTTKAHQKESESGVNDKSLVKGKLNMQTSFNTQANLDILDKKILYGLFSKNPQRLIDRENEEELLDDRPSH